MKKLTILIGIVMISAVIFTCCKKEEDLTVCTALQFEESSYTVETEKNKDITVNAEPEGTLEFNAVTFEITNPKIADIEFYEENVCTIKGLKSGATILKASCGDQEAKCIVSVYEEDDTSRSAVKREKKYYMYSLTYEIEEENYICTSFIKEKPYDYEIKDGMLTVVRDNGIMVKVPVNTIYDFGFYKID